MLAQCLCKKFFKPVVLLFSKVKYLSTKKKYVLLGRKKIYARKTMEQINYIYLRRLHDEECFGFLKFVVSTREDLPLDGEAEEGYTPELVAAWEKLEQAFGQFDLSLKKSLKNPGVAQAYECDAQRDKAWRTSNAYLKAMTEHPDEAIAAAARKAREIYVRYGNPTNLAQTKATGVYHNLLADIDQLSPEDKERSGIIPWYNRLRDWQNQFEEADSNRAEISGKRITGITRKARLEAETAYKNFVKTLNAHLLFRDGQPYTAFIKEVNAKMKEQKETLAKRKSLREKRKGKEEGGKEEGVQ